MDYKVGEDRSSWQSEDRSESVEVRTLMAAALLLWSFSFNPHSWLWFLLLKLIKMHATPSSLRHTFSTVKASPHQGSFQPRQPILLLSCCHPVLGGNQQKWQLRILFWGPQDLPYQQCVCVTCMWQLDTNIECLPLFSTLLWSFHIYLLTYLYPPWHTCGRQRTAY